MDAADYQTFNSRMLKRLKTSLVISRVFSAFSLCVACCFTFTSIIFFRSSDWSVTPITTTAEWQDLVQKSREFEMQFQPIERQMFVTSAGNIINFTSNISHRATRQPRSRVTDHTAALSSPVTLSRYFNRFSTLGRVRENQLTRQLQMSKVCADLSTRKPKVFNHQPDMSEMYVDDDRRYVYCLVSKVSCTSWKRTLLWMTGKTPFANMSSMSIGYIHNHDLNDQVMTRLIKLSEPEVEHRLNGGDYFKFVFVREPMSRLVSAYRDKILSDPSYHVSDYIVKFYRHGFDSALATNKSSNLSSSSSGASLNHSTSASENKTEEKATFREFVKFILDQRSMGIVLDRHWRPQTELCSPCLVKYDFIGHQETLHDDAEYVLHILRHRKLSTTPIPSMYTDIHFPKSDSSHGYDKAGLMQKEQRRKDTEESYIQKMLSQLSTQALQRIVDLYSDDFDLFGFKRPAKYIYYQKRLKRTFVDRSKNRTFARS